MNAAIASRGQAIAEFTVALAVLALLLVALPVIQRYHQLQFAGIGAARELAWAGEPAGALTNQSLYRRWLPEGDGDRDEARPQVRDLRAQPELQSLPGLAGAATQAMLLPFRPLQSLGGDSALGSEGLVVAHLNLQLASPDALPEPFAGVDLGLDEQHVLIADGWGAGGPAQVAERVAGLVPSHVLASAQPLLRVGTSLLSILEPGLRQLCLGQVNPEIVPADRLGTGSTGAPMTAWVPPC